MRNDFSREAIAAKKRGNIAHGHENYWRSWVSASHDGTILAKLFK